MLTIVTLTLVMVTAVGAAEDAAPTGVPSPAPAPAPPSLPSPAPLTAAWSKAPLCPLWGPMDSFYEEGIERGRVSWHLVLNAILVNFLKEIDAR